VSDRDKIAAAWERITGWVSPKRTTCAFCYLNPDCKVVRSTWHSARCDYIICKACFNDLERLEAIKNGCLGPGDCKCGCQV